MRDQGALPYVAYPPGVQVRIPSFREYFRRYAKRILTGGCLILWILIVGGLLAVFIIAFSWLMSDSLANTFLALWWFLAIVLIQPVFLTGVLALQSTRRSPLLDFAKNSDNVWLFVDLAAPYVEVFATCEQLIRKWTRGQPSQILASDGANGVLVCESPLSFPDNVQEINFRLERFWSRDTDPPYEITRVQILSRPITYSWAERRGWFDYAEVRSDPYFVKEAIRALKEKYPLLAEGPGENLLSY